MDSQVCSLCADKWRARRRPFERGSATAWAVPEPLGAPCGQPSGLALGPGRGSGHGGAPGGAAAMGTPSVALGQAAHGGLGAPGAGRALLEDGGACDPSTTLGKNISGILITLLSSAMHYFAAVPTAVVYRTCFKL